MFGLVSRSRYIAALKRAAGYRHVFNVTYEFTKIYLSEIGQQKTKCDKLSEAIGLSVRESNELQDEVDRLKAALMDRTIENNQLHETCCDQRSQIQALKSRVECLIDSISGEIEGAYDRGVNYGYGRGSDDTRIALTTKPKSKKARR